jgi:hypothetical protein
MTLSFLFKKDWQSGQTSFKKGQNVNGDVTENPTKAPYSITNPFHYIEVKDPRGDVKIPFCYVGEPIIEATVAPWLCQIDLTPTPVNPVKVVTDSVSKIGNVFTQKNTVIAIIVIVIIVSFIIYRILKNKPK